MHFSVTSTRLVTSVIYWVPGIIVGITCDMIGQVLCDLSVDVMIYHEDMGWGI